MTILIKHSAKNPPLAIVAAANACVASGIVVKCLGANQESPILTIVKSKDAISGSSTILRYLGRINQQYGADHLEAAQVDYFLSSLDQLADKAMLPAAAASLNTHLATRTVLVGHGATVADYAVVAALLSNPRFPSLQKQGKEKHVLRWFAGVCALPEMSQLLQKTAADTQKSKKEQSKGGAFAPLENAVEGQVVTRFPPEPSGYLHVGHIKALLLNDYFAKHYKGKMIMRFDDTNPSKEKDEYVKSILEDINTLGVVYGELTYTSDHFPALLDYATTLVKKGLAYVDNTPMEQMRAERMERVESKHRSNSVEVNMRMWQSMQDGTDEGKLCVLRAKINMQSENGTMRDPTMYRCNDTPHHRTGTKYKVYPTYDFACPIVDSNEGVTHVLRSVEFRDRNDQVEWFLKQLNLRLPFIWDYSRLNFVYTLMSKRKLQWFVDSGRVAGWDDPRFPTVRGMLRRGLTVEALREFIQLQGASRSSTLQEWDKLWSINKKVVDPIAPRYTAIAEAKPCLFTLSGAGPDEEKELALHPKNPDVGTKKVAYGSKIMIEQDDAQLIAQGEEVTLMGWGNAFADEITRDAAGVVTGIQGRLNLQGNVRSTSKKLTWLAAGPTTPLVLVELDTIITVKKMEEGMELKDVAREESWYETTVQGERAIAGIKKGTIVQIQRRGFFICDKAAAGDAPAVMILCPDGKGKSMSVLSSKVSKASGGNQDPSAPAPADKKPKQDKKAAAPTAAAPAAAEGAAPAPQKKQNKKKKSKKNSKK